MDYRLYVSLQDDDQILIYELHEDTGTLTLRREVSLTGGPAPLAVSPTQHVMYAGLRSSCEMATLRIDPQTGNLSPVGMVPLRSDPCYAATDRDGRFLFSAYYEAGLIAVHPIDALGMVQDPAVQWIETAPHAHCIQSDPSNQFVFVPHTVPSNRILQFGFDDDGGALTALPAPQALVEEGVGPRHYCFHPTHHKVYFSDEQGSSVTAYELDESRGMLTRTQRITSLPSDWEGRNAPAQIHMHPSGRFLYMSNRGHNSIAGFAIDEATGRLTSLGQQPTEAGPRAFNIDPSGHYLYVAGQGSSRLAAYEVDEPSGALTPLETYPLGQNPMWVLILALPEEWHNDRRHRLATRRAGGGTTVWQQARAGHKIPRTSSSS